LLVVLRPAFEEPTVTRVVSCKRPCPPSNLFRIEVARVLPPDDDAALVEDEADIVPPGKISAGFLAVVVRDVQTAA
jgi:hypothetical protein